MNHAIYIIDQSGQYRQAHYLTTEGNSLAGAPAASPVTKDPDELEYLATVWHEAGHGLINRIHHIEVHSLQALRPSEFRQGRRAIDRDGQLVPDAWGYCEDEDPPWIQVRDGRVNADIDRRWVLGHIAANVAGPVVEHLWRNNRQIRRRDFWATYPLRGITTRRCQDDDLRDACENAALLYPLRSAQNWLVRQQVNYLHRLCQKEAVWECLTRIAEALTLTGYLTGTALDTLIDVSLGEALKREMSADRIHAPIDFSREGAPS